MKLVLTLVVLGVTLSGLLADSAVAGNANAPCDPYVPARCNLQCTKGYQRDQSGCASCACIMDMCETTLCAPGTYCETMPCLKLPCTSRQASCLPIAGETPRVVCPAIQCLMACRNGNKKDINGCDVCECVDICKGFDCRNGEQCTENDDGTPRCVVKSSCQQALDLYEASLKKQTRDIKWKYEPACTIAGHWSPAQCSRDTCWCVAEDGSELSGTKVPKTDKDYMDCEFNRTVRAQISLKLSHNMDNIQSQLPSLQDIMKEHIANWLTVQKESVTEVVVFEHEIHVIRVDVTIVRDGDTDLFAAIVHFRELVIHGETQVQFGDQTLKPLPDSISVQHNYEESAENGLCEWLTDNYHAHPVLFGLCAVTACILLLTVIIALVVTCCTSKRRRRAKRFEVKNYDKNLAFICTTYPEVVLDDCDKLKLEDKDQLQLAKYNQSFIRKYPEVLLNDSDKVKLAEHDHLQEEHNA